MLTAESAILDLNQPIALSSKQNTEGLKVKHAHIERDVRIRDDRGTPLLLADDMNIGPMTYLDFDDATQQITSESHVVIVDPDQTTIGDGLVIQLRRPDPDGLPSSSSGGFGGVEYAILMKNHRVTLRDVGESGVFPGNNSSKKAAAPTKAVQVAASRLGEQGRPRRAASRRRPSSPCRCTSGPTVRCASTFRRTACPSPWDRPHRRPPRSSGSSGTSSPCTDGSTSSPTSSTATPCASPSSRAHRPPRPTRTRPRRTRPRRTGRPRRRMLPHRPTGPGIAPAAAAGAGAPADGADPPAGREVRQASSATSPSRSSMPPATRSGSSSASRAPRCGATS